jgi:surface antigen
VRNRNVAKSGLPFRRRILHWSAVGCLALVAAGAGPAQADPCQPYYGQGYCTDYVHSRVSVPWHGDAHTWGNQARANGWTVDSTPTPGAVAVYPNVPPVGHVAFVEQVQGNSYVVSEMNWAKGNRAGTPAQCAVTPNFGVRTQAQLTLQQRGGVEFLHPPGQAPMGAAPYGGAGRPPAYPEGSLVRARGAVSVYLIQGGQRHGIPDERTFRANGFQWTAVRDISQQELNAIPEGSPLPSASVGTSPVPAPYGQPRGYGGAPAGGAYPGSSPSGGSPSNPYAAAGVPPYGGASPVSRPRPYPTVAPTPGPVHLLPVEGTIDWDGNLLRARGDSRVYVMESGRRRWIPDEATFRSGGYDWSRVMDVDRAQLQAIPEGPPIPRAGTLAGPTAAPSNPYAGVQPPQGRLGAPPPRANPVTAPTPSSVHLLPLAGYIDGTLLRAQGDSRVYVMQSKQRHWVPDEATFQANGYRWESVRNIPSSEMQQIPEGAALSSVSAGRRSAQAPPPPTSAGPPSGSAPVFPRPPAPGVGAPPPTHAPAPRSWPEGALLRAQGDNRVYVIESGRRRWIPDEATMRARGYSFGAVQEISRSALDAIPEGSPLPRVQAPPPPPSRQGPSYAQGSLLRAQGDTKVYVIEGGQRHWVPDERTFQARGYSFASVREVPRQELMAIPEGSPIPTATR